MIYPIWFYEKDFKNGKPYPISPAESYDGEIDVTDLDTEQINEIVEDLERMGADFIAVCPDHQHPQGFAYPHIAVSFPDMRQVIRCARKYKGYYYRVGDDTYVTAR